MNKSLKEQAKIREMKRKEKELEKELEPRYEQLFNNIKRCSICGLAIAEGEENIHESFHNNFVTCKKNDNKNILTYQEIKKTEFKLNELLELIKNNDWNTGIIYATLALDLIYQLEYNYSQRLWSYSKPHPSLDDYIYLLWNTKEFTEKLAIHVPKDFISKEQEKYLANRKLKSSKTIFNDCFAFVNIEEVGNQGKNLSYLDSLVNCRKIEIEEELEEDYFETNVYDFIEKLFKKAV